MTLSPIALLLGALGVLTTVFTVGWMGWYALIGAVTNFFDTLGIGSFATTTSMYRMRRMVPDRLIPGTLNVGHTLPTIVQAFIYTQLIKVDVTTLVAMIGASVLGAWLGAGVVAHWSKKKIQFGMGIALIVTGVILAFKAAGQLPSADEGALGVTGVKLLFAISGNFVLGALMTIGIGLYAPGIVLVVLLGMNPNAAFPIMMGSCAFLMPVGSMRFVREKAYDPEAALGLAIGGVPAVLVAAFIVKSMPLAAVMWLVVVVVGYTAISLLRAGMAESEPAA